MSAHTLEVVKLKSKQGDIFEVEKDVACFSGMVKNMVEDTDVEYFVPLPMVDSYILAKVIEYCKYHQKAETEPPLSEVCYPISKEEVRPTSGFRVPCSAAAQDDKNKWDQTFVTLDDEILIPLYVAASYMDINPLLDLCCNKIANEIKGKTPEEIRTRFNIVNDLTPEDEEQAIQKNVWVENR